MGAANAALAQLLCAHGKMTDTFGRILAFVACLVGLPIHLAICLAIRLQDRGPAIYRCRRLGRHGRIFTMFKYRTMRVGCPPLLKSGFKVVVENDDSRVTPLGHLLRCGVDELPQLWNIVRGEMTWVGPRPDESWMIANYGPMCTGRLASKPGITGLAQILDSRNCSTPVGYAIDVWYNRHRRFSADLWVVCATPLFILGWRSIGSGRLRRLMQNANFVQIVAVCQQEIESAVKVTS